LGDHRRRDPKARIFRIVARENLEGDFMNSSDLSTGAQSLVFDLANGCTAYQGSNSVPCIVVPKPGGPKPRTVGQIPDVFVKELLDKGVMYEADNRVRTHPERISIQHRAFSCSGLMVEEDH
jgi:hypothetical protein